MKSNRGFSLLETLLYLAIFAVVGGSLFGILTNVVRVSTREISGDEVASQLQFAMGTINRLVRESSNIEMATTTATTTLKLRMPVAAQDPTCISVVNGVLKLAQGPLVAQPSQYASECTSVTTDLTTNKIVVDTAWFKRAEFPGGHDQVSVDLQFSNTATGASKISRAIRSGISRASAATFDSDLLPNQDALYEVGSSIPGGKRWKNGAFSGNLTVLGNMGIGTANPQARIDLGTGTGAKLLWYDDDTSGPFAGTKGGIYLDQWGLSNNTTMVFATAAANPGTFIIAAKDTGGTTLAELVRIQGQTGNVGIGTTAPTYKLQVAGNSANSTGVWAVSSDERLKRDIVPIAGALQTITALQGVGFNWRDKAKDDQFGRVMGFVAQDVEKVLPQWVKTDADGYKRIETIGMDALLVEAIKEQQKQIEALRMEIKELKAK